MPLKNEKYGAKAGGGSRDKDVVSDDSDARCGDVNTGISSYAFHGIIIYNKGFAGKVCNDHFMKLWIVRLERRNCMKAFKEFLGEEDRGGHY